MSRKEQNDWTFEDTIEIITTPIGAEIYFDKVFHGFSPLIIYSINPGSHEISVGLDGYISWNKIFQTFEEEKITIRIDLRESNQNVSNLIIKTLPLYSDFFIDDVYYGKTPQRDCISISEGKHRIKIQHDGYCTIEEDLNIKNGINSIFKVLLPQESPVYFDFLSK